MKLATIILASLISVYLLFTPRAISAESLHERIDKSIAAAHEGPTAPQSSDAEFLRRVVVRSGRYDSHIVRSARLSR